LFIGPKNAMSSRFFTASMPPTSARRTVEDSTSTIRSASPTGPPSPSSEAPAKRGGTTPENSFSSADQSTS